MARGGLSRGRAAALVMALAAMALAPTATAAAPVAAIDVPLGPPTAQVGTFSFELGPYKLVTLSEDRLPYYGATLVPGCGLTDAAGVAMYRASNGVIHDHPVAQAQCALNMLRNYRLVADQAYLDQAIANARRLLDRAVSHAGGIFFPYPFAWSNPGRGSFIPPWYSAMAQGQALSVFVRLAEWTGDDAWMTDAARTFASFTVARTPTAPWVAGVEGGLLWLDEYPTTPIDRVFNGQVFAIYGLYDYWRTTGNADAAQLALGAIHSTHVAASTRIRVPGGISHYCSSDACMRAAVKNAAYHPTHISQLRNLFWLTGDWRFASLAEAFMADVPYASSGQAVLRAGIHSGYTFDADAVGAPAATATFGSDATASYSQRTVPGAVTRPGNGIWLRLSSGPLAGLWVRESAVAWPIGIVDRMDFLHERPVDVAGGTYVGHTRDAFDSVLDTLEVSTADARWTYTEVARINGRQSVLLATGPLAGRWLALDARTTRDTTMFTDIDGSAFRGDIIWLTDQGITRGCTTWRYCPRSTVTREQMASFLARALGLPSTDVDYFADDDASIHEGDINRVAAAGISGGCAPSRFCPTATVNREQMAAFVRRAVR